MADITNQSLNEIIENVKTKKVSSTDLTKAYIKKLPQNFGWQTNI